MQNAFFVLYCQLWPVCLYHSFPRYLINGKIFRKKYILIMKCDFKFSLQILSKIFVIPKIFQKDIIINLLTSSRKVLAILVIF